ncbi:hypothetical protein TIFTF001_002043 [Ficus carica]|uniref:Uncharacterized protein n=1 Tax=Ficus carica TaxID=3494 RepID=A0AA87ZK29_FICCA|nr:hypothetical protein TIFTF001_002043 [Ficus carica]
MRRMAIMVENFKELSAFVPIMNVPINNIDDCRFEEPTPREEHVELFHDDDSVREVEVQDLIVEEKSQDEIHSAQSFVPTFIIQDHIYEDPMWPTPPPPTLASFLHVHQAHIMKPNHVEHT